ncbi:hypothetical protein Lal_00031774 [Lupinus albus]|nr:hypothetical protein Lal_00031774 [Lupinus albus]
MAKFLKEQHNNHLDDIGRHIHASTPSSSPAQQPPPIPLPFPPNIIPIKKMEEVGKEILETFRKVEVNIPLLDAIKQIPRYEKFLKELCSHKRKLKGNERISMGRNVSALIGKPIPHIPEKCKDPGTFTVPCIIGNNKFENAMLDLGASINVMPMSVFMSLSIGPLKPTGTEEGSSRNTVPIILGRLFLRTARTKIDIHVGTLSMEFDDIVVRFNIFDAMKHPYEDHSVFHVDFLDELINEHISDFIHDSDSLSLIASHTCHACTDYEL